MDILADGNINDSTFDYNLWYGEGAVFATHPTDDKADFAEFQADYGIEANGVSADPLFVDAANGDFTKQDTSPCVHAGTWVDLKLDYAGNPVVPGAVDMGAFQSEYGGGDQISTSTYWRRRRRWR